MAGHSDSLDNTPVFRVQIQTGDYPDEGLTASVALPRLGPQGTIAARALAWKGPDSTVAYVAFASAPQNVPPSVMPIEADGFRFYPVQFLVQGHEKAMQIVALHQDSGGPWEVVF